MKYILRIFLVLLTVSMPLFGKDTPHLILYFDINKTLIASDKAGNKSVEDTLNELLAEQYKACWNESLQEEMTFDEYVHEVLVPGPRDSQELKTQRRLYLQHFIDYLYEQNHPLYKTALEDYETALMTLNTSQGMVFPSFYSLLNDLNKKDISYSIILRSFGDEVFEVKTEINRVHKMMFNQMAKFREGKLLLEESELIENPWKIYNQLRHIKHIAIHDDWNYWNSHGEFAKQGKPFYINKEDTHTLSIFFDDNIRENDSIKNIIAPLDAKTGELIPIEALILSGQAVRVDTLKAILNDDYYINCIEEAIYKHSLRK